MSRDQSAGHTLQQADASFKRVVVHVFELRLQERSIIACLHHLRPTFSSSACILASRRSSLEICPSASQVAQISASVARVDHVGKMLLSNSYACNGGHQSVFRCGTYTTDVPAEIFVAGEAHWESCLRVHTSHGQHTPARQGMGLLETVCAFLASIVSNLDILSFCRTVQDSRTVGRTFQPSL